MGWLIQIDYFEHEEGPTIKEIKLIREANSFQEASLLAKRWAKENGFYVVNILNLTLEGLKLKPWLDI